MKKFYLSAGILLIAIFVRAQQPFTPHVVFDNNNKVYAVKASPSSFLKFIDSTGQFSTKHVTNGKDYVGKGHTVRQVPPGQETTYENKEEAQALLDYWNLMKLQKEQQKKKPSSYSE
jgi:hypothetical protein